MKEHSDDNDSMQYSQVDNHTFDLEVSDMDDITISSIDRVNLKSNDHNITNVMYHKKKKQGCFSLCW